MPRAYVTMYQPCQMHAHATHTSTNTTTHVSGPRVCQSDTRTRHRAQQGHPYFGRGKLRSLCQLPVNPDSPAQKAHTWIKYVRARYPISEATNNTHRALENGFTSSRSFWYLCSMQHIPKIQHQAAQVR